MRETILIKKPINSPVDGGGYETIWDLEQTEWAKVEPVKSTFGLTDSQMKLRDALKFTIRFISVFPAEWLIQYENRDYTISSIKEIQERKRFLEIIAMTNNDSNVPITT